MRNIEKGEYDHVLYQVRCKDRGGGEILPEVRRSCGGLWSAFS